LRNNPAVTEHKNAAVAKSNPYGMQSHIYDTTRPENLAFFEKVRTLLNEYDAASIGEIGADDALAVMAQYTADDNKLHMAYSFNLLTDDHSAAYIRKQVEEFEAKVKGGWASWSVGNHDVTRVMTRWGGKDAPSEYAKALLAMQLSLKGTPCLYQGDELALNEADLPYEVLQDPVGLIFWPEVKGRDGCRTPMPWDANQTNAGFSSGKPWLPVPAEHASAAATQQSQNPYSLLNFSRKLIAWRKTVPQLMRGDIAFYDAPEPVLALRRDLAGLPSVIAVVNMGAQAVSFDLPDSAAYDALSGHGMVGRALNGKVELPGYGAWFGMQH
ncbi:MAG: alpha-amylase family glycosyl hydrolase, partial [Undibacterium sp.]|uniref:alpha-amylase family glycosyl hydrolase n=1 Tax=Undibacterium sp. TaxID=1914977 RepID=UPI00271834FE